MSRLSRSEGTWWAAWVKLDSWESTTILAHAGVEVIVIDAEHTMLDPSAIARHIAVGQAHGMRALVRVPDQGASFVQRVLDAGADGIVVPHVDGPSDAAAVVSATRFAPGGRRGSGATSRAGSWGQGARSDYLARQVEVIAQIESRAALESVEEIAAVDGITGLLLGAADLTLDARGAVPDADVTVAAAARAHGIAAGAAGGPAGAARARELGLDFYVGAADTTLLADAAARAVQRMRALEDHTGKASSHA
ncbi:HpcH/HpaI aldolase/citrate lyase family protein [Nocardiopsis sp. MG754419]|uniref:HpcH/HpaI aldolase family protein n=1 Tax=Nocardiopsis sp. MG754419 TaxID=2259865 RepID=UPI001BAE0310|nr:aldolase/citrate lyase family protein [Nocardiopsis sp. MG754419]MBR8741629.1 2,4-dihydroxyhept-2-ene-1,7-dioic acid aldolase [Nocardiopsis sp. MG754419]